MVYRSNGRDGRWEMGGGELKVYFVDCATGMCNSYYYDERTAGKDGNCVSSVRCRGTHILPSSAQFQLKLG